MVGKQQILKPSRKGYKAGGYSYCLNLSPPKLFIISYKEKRWPLHYTKQSGRPDLNQVIKLSFPIMGLTFGASWCVTMRNTHLLYGITKMLSLNLKKWRNNKEIHNVQYSIRQLAWTLQNANILKDRTR